MAQRLSLGEAPGVVLHVLDLGATVQSLEVTCGDGRRRNVVLGYGKADDYLSSTDYLGATIGRYANRIADGRFQLDGRQVHVGVHDRGNHLHGGPDGFDRRTWTIEEHSPSRAVLSLISPDMDQGFPGELRARVSYAVQQDAVRIEFEAITNATTVVNMTNHAYFNLDGEGTGTVDRHVLRLDADWYTPVDARGIPTGPDERVGGTSFDFSTPRVLARAIRSSDPQVRGVRGLDHSVTLRGVGLRRAASLFSSTTSTSLDVLTDQPCLQVYTGNLLDGSRPGSSGALYRQGDGVALEPQLRPNSPQSAPQDAILRPGEVYRATLEWRFGQGPP